MQARIYRYNTINNLVGWLVFAIAAVVYSSTIEPTVSFWDCPEFILSSYKLEIGHPPGAPFFMLTANLFSQFASSPAEVARMVNLMNAWLSALTVLFLFWTITRLVRRLMEVRFPSFIPRSSLPAPRSPLPTPILIIQISGIVGALIYAFSDTFWFSAVEGEVYAYSSAFTAAVFWLILKWEAAADEAGSDRWLILIAYLTGLSIGVHLLNLLCLPALVLVFYHRRSANPTWRGALLAVLLSFVLIAVILLVFIPGVCTVGGWVELLWVNHLHLPFNGGVIVYLIILLGSLFAAIAYTQKHRKRVANTLLLSLLMMLIGYGSYAVVVIRANANTPMNQNGCKDVFTLSRYLARDQYPHGPLLYGQAYTSQVKLRPEGNYCVPEVKQGKALWQQVPKDNGTEDDAYTVVGHSIDYVYEPNMLFPRMWSGSHAQAYEAWTGGIHGRTVYVDRCGETVLVQMPSVWDNLRFFLVYQCGFMYARYFLWNFAGRQNDIQGHGEPEHGNWLTGFSFLDRWRLGDQSLLPDELQTNKGHNVYYCLPLLLGLLGLYWQSARCGKAGRRQFWVVLSLFLMTGLAIVVYVNQTPFQPRERDYSYAGSFYAFAIWCGMGVAALSLLPFRKYLGALAALACLVIPLQMASQNWDDHDRSGRYICRDAGHNYLASLPDTGHPVILTNGDNDTFPLWYMQEVEGYRTDVRVCNLQYLQTDWYISQMRLPAYDSPALPIDWKPSEYLTGRNDAYSLSELPDDTLRLDDRWKIPLHGRHTLYKADLMLLELLKHTDQRPLYVAESVGTDDYLNLDDQTVCEGLACRFEPSYQPTPTTQHPTPNTHHPTPINTAKTYRNLMQRFRFTGLDDPKVYLDETCRNMAYRYRRLFVRLALALIDEGKPQQALAVVRKADQVMPVHILPPDIVMGSDYDMARAYLLLGKKDEAIQRINSMRRSATQMLQYYESFTDSKRALYERDIERQRYILQILNDSAG